MFILIFISKHFWFWLWLHKHSPTVAPYAAGPLWKCIEQGESTQGLLKNREQKKKQEPDQDQARKQKPKKVEAPSLKLKDQLQSTSKYFQGQKFAIYLQN